MKAKFVQYIEVNDPDTGGTVQMVLYKHENGGLFDMDASYLEQVAAESEPDDCYTIPDPFGDISDPNTLDLFD